MKLKRIGIAVLTPALAAILAASAAGQRPPAAGQGSGASRGGQSFGRGGGQGGGFGMGRGMRGPVTAATAPPEALQKALGLSAAQVQKIEAIQAKHRDSIRALFPQGGFRPGGGSGGPGGGPSAGRAPGGTPGAARAPASPPQRAGSAGMGRPGGARGGSGGPPFDFQQLAAKAQGVNDKANKEVAAVLTSGQRSKLAGALKQFETLRNVGIPLQVAHDLKLTGPQMTKLSAISTEAAAQRRQMFQAMMGGPGGAPGGRPGAGPAMRGGGPGAGPGGGPGGGGQDMRDRRRSMREATRKKVDAVLTPAQKAILKKFEDANPRGQGAARVI